MFLKFSWVVLTTKNKRKWCTNNFVLRFLQKEDVDFKAKQHLITNKTLQYMLPGGFDENVLRNRNWAETISALGLSRPVGSLTKGDGDTGTNEAKDMEM